MEPINSSRFHVRPISPSEYETPLVTNPSKKLAIFITTDDDDVQLSQATSGIGRAEAARIAYAESNISFSHDICETMPRESHYAMPNDPNSSKASKKRSTLEALQEAVEDSSDEHGHRSVASPNFYGAADGSGMSLLDKSHAMASVHGELEWFNGVFVRCLLNFCGIVLFLRLSWCVGSAGLFYTSGVIGFTIIISALTALSVAAIYSNVVVRTGDAYFIISRSLGPEFGGAIGFLLSAASALLTAFNVTGIAELVVAIIHNNFGLSITHTSTDDIRVAGCLLLIGLLIVVVGLNRRWEARIQSAYLGLVTLALFNFFVGAFRPSGKSKLGILEARHGFSGFDRNTFYGNLWPAFQSKHMAASLINVFVVIFPMAAGVISGVDISGDLLRDAPNAVPYGTLTALSATAPLYVACAWLMGATMVRQAPKYHSLGMFDAVNTTLNATFSGIDCRQDSCPFGLLNNYRSMEYASFFGPLLLPGVFIAALSSARTSFVCAGRVWYAVCADRLFPYIQCFGVLSSTDGWGFYHQTAAPIRAYAVIFAIVCASVVGIADVNTIASAVTVVLLMLFALLNYACFDASLSESPGFRPRFVPYYSKWTALAGALLSVAAVFAVSWQAALVMVILIAVLSVYVYRVAKPASCASDDDADDICRTTTTPQQRDWGTSWDANVYRRALAANLRLIRTVDHVKTYRPQALVLTGFPASRPALVDLVAAFTNNEQALMICGHVIVQQPDLAAKTSACDYKARKLLIRQAYSWLARRRVSSFYTQIVMLPESEPYKVSASPLRRGARAFMQGAGLGKLRPNVVFMGYLTNFAGRTFAGVRDYVGTIADAFDNNMGVGLLKMSRVGMDLQDDVEQKKAKNVEAVIVSENKIVLNKKNNNLGLPYNRQRRPSVPCTPPPPLPAIRMRRSSEQHGAAESVEQQDERWPSSSEQVMQSLSANQELMLRKVKRANYFARHHLQHTGLLLHANPSKKGAIHVWWLYDDGGLTVLIPYLLAQKWKLPLHLFYLSPATAAAAPPANVSGMSEIDADKALLNNNNKEEKRRKASRQVDSSQRKMLQLLSKFRIAVENVTPVTVEKWPPPEADRLLTRVKQRMGRFYAGNNNNNKENAALRVSSPVGVEEEAPAFMPTTSDDDETGTSEHMHQQQQSVAHDNKMVVTEADFEYNRDKTLRQLKLCQLIQQHSRSSAALVVLSLPMYRRQSVSPALYAMWLECLTGGMMSGGAHAVSATNDMPPVLLLRGNQKSVLTFDL